MSTASYCTTSIAQMSYKAWCIHVKKCAKKQKEENTFLADIKRFALMEAVESDMYNESAGLASTRFDYEKLKEVVKVKSRGGQNKLAFVAQWKDSNNDLLDSKTGNRYDPIVRMILLVCAEDLKSSVTTWQVSEYLDLYDLGVSILDGMAGCMQSRMAKAENDFTKFVGLDRPVTPSTLHMYCTRGRTIVKDSEDDRVKPSAAVRHTTVRGHATVVGTEQDLTAVTTGEVKITPNEDFFQAKEQLQLRLSSVSGSDTVNAESAARQVAKEQLQFQLSSVLGSDTVNAESAAGQVAKEQLQVRLSSVLGSDTVNAESAALQVLSQSRSQSISSSEETLRSSHLDDTVEDLLQKEAS